MTTNIEWEALGKVWIRGPYLVTVDYTKSVQDMVENWEKAASFNWTDHNIKLWSLPISGAGVVEVEIVLIYFGREVKYEEVIKEMEQMDLRPALLPELLALGIKYNSLPYMCGIFALGSMLEEGKDRFKFPFLGSDWGDAGIVADFFRGEPIIYNTAPERDHYRLFAAIHK